MASNPVLNDKRFEQVIAEGYGTSPVTRTMTYGGTMSALGVMFAIICVMGWVGWSQVNQTTQEVFDGQSSLRLLRLVSRSPPFSSRSGARLLHRCMRSAKAHFSALFPPITTRCTTALLCKRCLPL